MAILALEVLYVTVRRIQQRYEEGSPRLNPGSALVFWLAPVLYSLLRISVPEAWMLDTVAKGHGFWTSASPLYLFAIAISSWYVWAQFDRRREVLDLKFPDLPSLKSVLSRALFVATFLIVTFTLTWLSFHSTLTCVAFFVAVCILVSIVSRQSLARGDRTGESK